MRVFKYRGGPENFIRRDIRTLFNNMLYAAPVESLNDLLEAQISFDYKTFRFDHMLDYAGPRFKEDPKAVEDEFRSAIKNFALHVRTWGVYSLSQSATHELLWAHYADSHRGFCMEYELEDLLSYQLADSKVLHVSYEDTAPKIRLRDLKATPTVELSYLKVPVERRMPRNIREGISEYSAIQKFIGTKSKAWEYEKEVRILTDRLGLFEYDFRALKAIYFGARSTKQLRRRVMRAMAGRGLEYYEIVPIGEQYILETTPIVDMFARHPDYRKRISPIESGIPHWDKKTSKYMNEILQAINIVRRDPYCEIVTDAYLSPNGTPHSPIFCVAYKRIDGVPKVFCIDRKQNHGTRDA